MIRASLEDYEPRPAIETLYECKLIQETRSDMTNFPGKLLNTTLEHRAGFVRTFQLLLDLLVLVANRCALLFLVRQLMWYLKFNLGMYGPASWLHYLCLCHLPGGV
jgi:hypothetical protein